MALVPVRVSATIVDEWGIKASAAMFATADDSQTLAALNTEANAFVSALDATTDGQITQSRVTVFPALPGGVKSAPVAGSRVEQVGELGFLATGSAKRYTTVIPSISNGVTVLTADRIVLNVVDPVGLLIKILTTVGTVLHWCNEHYQQIQKFIDAVVAYRRKEKALSRSSFEL